MNFHQRAAFNINPKCFSTRDSVVGKHCIGLVSTASAATSSVYVRVEE